MAGLTPQLVVALDFQTGAEALDLARRLAPTPGLWMKVGLELYVAEGPRVVRELKALGLRVFVDLKFLDIPNTVAGAVRSCVAAGADMLNVHAIGGADMLRAAVAARDSAAADNDLPQRPLLLAVTVLTSTQDPESPVLRGRPAGEAVLELARLAQGCGLDGVVCSGHEAAAVKAACGGRFVCLTPGIRVPGPDSSADDQRRVMTPEAAVAAGSDYLVVGRPITRAPEHLGGPEGAARAILLRMAGA